MSSVWIEPKDVCVQYVKDTGAELWVDEDNCYFVVYPTAREAMKHGKNVLGMIEMYDVGAFDVRALAKPVVENMTNVRRVL